MLARPSLIWYSRSSRCSRWEEQSRWQAWLRINTRTMHLPETQSNELFLKKSHKSSHVDVIHHCLRACGLIPLMWIGFEESLSRFLRWWSPRKFTTTPVSRSCRPNRSTVQRVQRQIRWRRPCRRRSGAQTERTYWDFLWYSCEFCWACQRRCSKM